MLKHRQSSNSHRDSNANHLPTNGNSHKNMAYYDPTSSLGAEDSETNVNSSLPVESLTIEEQFSTKENSVLENIRGECDGNHVGNNVLSRQRIIAFVIVLTVVLIVVCFSIGYYYIGYYPEEKSLNYGDQRCIDYSTYFCSSVSSDSNDIWLTVVSSLDYTEQLKYTNDAVLYLEVGQIWSRMFHLNMNSMININIAGKGIIFVLVFKGKQNFILWVERKTTLSYILQKACCINGKETIYFKANESEDYYIVFYREESFGSPVTFNASLDFIRPKVDSSKVRRQCKVVFGGTCTVGLSYASSEKIIIEMPHYSKQGMITKETKIRWKCNARIWFYCVIFGFSIICISVFVIVSYVNGKKLLKSRCSKSSQYSYNRQMPIGTETVNSGRNCPKLSHDSISSNKLKYANLAAKEETCDINAVEKRSFDVRNNNSGRELERLQERKGSVATICKDDHKMSKARKNEANSLIGIDSNEINVDSSKGMKNTKKKAYDNEALENDDISNKKLELATPQNSLGNFDSKISNCTQMQVTPLNDELMRADSRRNSLGKRFERLRKMENQKCSEPKEKIQSLKSENIVIGEAIDI